MGALDELLPRFAPVPHDILKHLLLNRRRDSLLRVSKRSPGSIKIVPANALEEETGFRQEEWDGLLRDIRAIRQSVFADMDPVVKSGRLTTAWLSQALQEATPRRSAGQERARTRVPRSTVAGWEQRGLVTREQRNRPNLDVAAALLIARRAEPERLRNWLPSETAPTLSRALDAQSDEALGEALDGLYATTWLACLRQDPPREPGSPPPEPVPSPFPLPAGLNKASLFVSPWMGFLWKPFWRRRVNSLGVARWYGATEAQWDVTLEDLSRWIVDTNKLAVPDMEREAPDVFQELTDTVLNRVGYTLLSRYG